MSVKMVKEKQVRTYDQEGFRKRAACLCVRDPQELEILLVTSSRGSDSWIVPGGGVEPNENPSDAAIRETEEEAGVKGVIKRCLGVFEVRDENLERKHRTSVFVLEVNEELDEWEDSKCRQRRWFPVEEALRLLTIHKPLQCTYIQLLIQTSPSLSQLVPHLLESSPCNLSNSLPISPSNSDPSVNHYPSDGNNKTSGNTASFRTFICTRDVYSTDSEIGSETAEDGPSLIDTPNHFSADVKTADAVCDKSDNSNNKKPDGLLSSVTNSSSVNS